MTVAVRVAAVVPTYDNPLTVRAVAEGIRAHGLDVIVVDDGSGPEGRAACEALARDGLAAVHRLPQNAGKGAAVRRGFAAAFSAGFTHGFQIDADGQHDLGAVPAFVNAAHERPDALVLGYPVYDESAPAARRIGRRLTSFWVALEVGSRATIRDAMIGFRVYPLAATMALGRTADRMAFDIEIAVRLVRAGVPTVNLPVAVRYLQSEDGGVSHFRPLRDNLEFSWLHTRLCTAGCFAWLRRKVTGRTR